MLKALQLERPMDQTEIWFVGCGFPRNSIDDVTVDFSSNVSDSHFEIIGLTKMLELQIRASREAPKFLPGKVEASFCYKRLALHGFENLVWLLKIARLAD